MTYNHIAHDERASLGGLSSAEAQALTSQTLQENDSQTSTLRERRLELSRLHNSVASINAKLPVEILVSIFRLAGSLTAPQNSIRLTHVCHAWRTLIHNTPTFWTNFLFPPPGIQLVDGTRYPFIVLDALARTAPMRFTLALYGEFLPTIRTSVAEAHLSRMSALCLDCAAVEDGDMRPFFDLSLPTLESLELRLDCSILILPESISAESQARFPRLRALTTTCVSFPLAWVGSSLRVLTIRAGVEAMRRPRDARRLRCCGLRSVPDFLMVLERCPNLEQLKLFGALPYYGPHGHQDPAVTTHSPPLRLDHLDSFTIGDDVGYIRSFLECFVLPPETILTVCTDSAHDTLSEFLPVRNPLKAIPLINQVKISACRPAGDYPHIVQGYVEEADGVSRSRLALLSSDITYDNLDLLRLFRGVAPIFSPTAVIDLEVTLCEPVRHGQNAAWLWLLRYFPRLTVVTIVAANGSEDFFLALAQDDVSPELTDLRVVHTGVEDLAYSLVYEDMVYALERRASRGVRLRSFVHRQQMERRPFGRLPSPLPVTYLERLQAVVGELEVPPPCYVD